MGAPIWTDAETWAARRAGDLYDRQWRLIKRCENFTRGPHALHDRYSRTQGWVAPGGTEKIPLRIEREPDVVAAEIAAMLAAEPNNRSVMPACLVGRADAAANVPQARVVREADDPILLQMERQILTLKDELSDARKKLKVAHRDESVIEALASIVRTETQPLPPVQAPHPGRPTSDATPVDAVLVLSDEHGDQRVEAAGAWGLERYNFNVFRARLHRLVRSTSRWLTHHLPRHHVERLWVFKLGDSVQGDIHGHGPRNHFGNTVKAALAVGDAEAHAIQYLRRETGIEVIVVSVPGNHGRRSLKKDYGDPHDHFDYLVATQIRTRLSGQDGVQVFAPRSWTAFVDVRGWTFALNHGDDARGVWGIPWYGFTRRNSRVQAAVGHAGGSIDFHVYGHYHTPALTPATGGQSWHNGAFPAADPYSAEALQGFTNPQQWLFMIDDERGMNLPIPIYLRDTEAEARLHSGEWDPEIGRRTVLDEVDPAHGSGGLNIIRAA